jgi:hypothetical protein
MYRLFLTIFLWFWLTTWGMLAIVFLGSQLTGIRQVSAPNMYATVAPILADQAAKAYESGGPEAFARFSQSDDKGRARQLFLLDGFYKDVLSRPLTNDGFVLRTQRRMVKSSYSEPISLATGLSLPRGIRMFCCST